MNCTQAAECVSALFDSHQISREVAAHLAECHECRVRLNEYAEMGAELRDLSSAATTQAIPEGRWRLAEPAAGNNWLRKWRGTMRIPRFAFALMLIALLVLSLSTGLFLTRAKGTDRWFQYEILGRDGKWIMRGAVPPNGEGNSYYDADAGMTYPDGIVLFHFRMMERVGDAERIRARAVWVPRGDHSGRSFQSLNDTPEQEFLYSLGEDLKIPVDGYGNLTIKGHFEPTLPQSMQGTLYPGDGKFRIDPPVVLVREKQMLGKYDGGGGELFFDKSYFAYGQQEEGWYLFSAKPFAGATEGALTMNQVEFNIDGKQYLLLTGDPILFGRVKVWVKHYASIQEADSTKQSGGWQQNGTELAFGQLENLVIEK